MKPLKPFDALHRHYVRELRTALLRLFKSHTQVTRRNARRKLRSAVKLVEREILEAFPLLDAQGNQKPKKRSPACPLCKAPMGSFRGLCKHLYGKHGAHTPSGQVECPCGAGFGPSAILRSYIPFEDQISAFARHLAAQKNYQLHLKTAFTTKLLGSP